MSREERQPRGALGKVALVFAVAFAVVFAVAGLAMIGALAVAVVAFNNYGSNK